MAHQVHDCATTHVMTIRIGRAGLKRLIPAGRDSLLRALAGLSGGANRGRDPYQEPKHPRSIRIGEKSPGVRISGDHHNVIVECAATETQYIKVRLPTRNPR